MVQHVRLIVMLIGILLITKAALKALQMRRLVVLQHLHRLEATKANVTAVIVSCCVNVSDVPLKVRSTVVLLAHLAEDRRLVHDHVRRETKLEIKALRT